MKDIVSEINEAAVQFGVIVDGTQDISGMEQECICIRYVSEDLSIHLKFIGMYEASDTSGASICSIIKDTLIRFNLPLKI